MNEIPSIPYMLQFPSSLSIARFISSHSSFSSSNIEREPEQQALKKAKEDEYEEMLSDTHLCDTLPLSPLPPSSSSNLASLPLSPSLPLEKYDCYLLTGATGFIGQYILRELLFRSQAESRRPAIVFCLVRAVEDKMGEDRLKGLLGESWLREGEGKVWEFSKFSELFNKEEGLGKENQLRSRCVVLAGDLSRERFGLDKTVEDVLKRVIRGVYHVGARVNHMLPYSILRRDNVLGTKNIVEFCCGGQFLFSLSPSPSYFLFFFFLFLPFPSFFLSLILCSFQILRRRFLKNIFILPQHFTLGFGWAVMGIQIQRLLLKK